MNDSWFICLGPSFVGVMVVSGPESPLVSQQFVRKHLFLLWAGRGTRANNTLTIVLVKHTHKHTTPHKGLCFDPLNE